MRDMPCKVRKCPVYRVPAAKHLVAIGTDIGNEGLNLVPGYEILVKHDGKDLDRGLKFLRNNLVGADGLQVLCFVNVPRPHDDEDGRVEPPAEAYNLPCSYGIVDRNHGNPGCGYTGMDKHPVSGSIPEHHGFTLVPCGLDKIGIEFNDRIDN